MHRAATLRAQVGPRDAETSGGPTKTHRRSLVLLSVPIFTLPPLVAASQTIGLLGALVVVAVAFYVEAVGR